ncbi:GTPase HflX [Clostridium sp. MD294]|uniref:GTPase HflX n=1 Tax=Clostridium sp. MD294 TaxID=97138 RepID=UPI0002C95D3F|nr:GTPase HflX [Clostridium sp. MD294]NDO45784.1 GTPase HflX [Clostridium sp. MD294]USF30561.1 GTPase HflX [Clostridium sp. MD294]
MAKQTQLHISEQTKERVILVAVDLENNTTMDTEACLNELEELVKTAGAVTVATVVQKRERIHSGHYIGKGKIEEIKMMIQTYDASGIVCDDELSPAQMKNLEQMLQTKIMDRTMVILDIFASRAMSKEGKIQVELAQLKYRLSRLAGIGASMSRLGGGIGTRGPGETKLETNRRHIKDRIGELNQELNQIQTHRQLLRNQRNKKGTPLLSLVGYTNAGKSTLINTLTDAGVLAEDKLFATLDTTTRKVKLPNGTEILLTDTVGFIQKLPHHLIQAFRATLEELNFADILIHVVDASNENRQEQMNIVYQTLKGLHCETTPVITVYNKIDKNVQTPLPIDNIARDKVAISAKTKQGLDSMLEKIETLLKSFRIAMKVFLPYTEGSLLNMIHGKCEIVVEQHRAEGVYLEIYAQQEMENRLQKYKI